ncbi:MAG: carboxyl transferase domain-containing protein [Ilumatobacteraceae bacterium]
MLPRDRVDGVLDPGAVPRTVRARRPRHVRRRGAAAGIITGVGQVSGRRCVIVANDATVKGGTYFPVTVKKHLRAQEVALQNRLPCIYLVDSGGAFLPEQDSVFPDRDISVGSSTTRRRCRRRASPRSPRCSGRAPPEGYVPAMSDEAIIVRDPGHDLPRRTAPGEGGDG